MQYIAIKQSEKDGKQIFTINAIPLKNTNNSVVQKIPHPLGSDILEYDNLEKAKEAVSRAGFSYILPDGQKEVNNKKEYVIFKSKRGGSRSFGIIGISER